MGPLRGRHEPTLFRKRAPLGIRLTLIAGFSITLMTLDIRQSSLQPIRDVLGQLIRPAQVVSEIPIYLADLHQNFIDRAHLVAENRKLKQERLLMQARLQKLAALEAENQRIRALLQSSRSLEEKVLIAEILAASTDPYRHYLKLNRGANDGVTEGQALIDAHGIIGQIVNVGSESSTAILLTDADHGIPVQINRNNIQTIAQGGGAGFTLRLPYLPSNADIQEGDLLVSSGLGGRFPAGYPVGTVTHIQHQPGDEFLEVWARPAARLNQGREVLLVRTQIKRNDLEEAQIADSKDSPSSEPAKPQP